MTQYITFPQLAWHGIKYLKLSLPDSWDAEIYNMTGHDRPHISPAEIGEAVKNPIEMKPLREYARGKQEVVIIFDDMARVTRVFEIVPHVLEELAAAGIGDKQIRFIAACGCHAAMNRMDFEKKLGADVLKRFSVYNHAPYGKSTYVNTTTRGTKLYINAEVMKCDLKIGIGSVVPHIMAGFGGGGKIVLPGVAAYRTIVALHSPKVASETTGVSDTVTGMGNIDDNPRRRDINEAVEMAGLDMKIDALVNGRGETTAVFAGSPVPTYALALKAAKEHYLTRGAKDKDIIIANTFAKANEAVSGLLAAFPSVTQRGGDIVLIANAPEGQITHYLMGPFGNEIGGALQLQMEPPENVNRLVIFSEYPELSSRKYLEASDRIVLVNDWDEVISMLRESYGNDASVGIYPNADIQYCR
ncbi:MAG: lactate racemase domain-containing protein [Dehalococcoidia bacterium]|jgi:nickel-dependent lactate racemase